MPEYLTDGDKFIQLGFAALRDPANGEFLPSIPLYVKIAPETINAIGLAPSEEILCSDIASAFAKKFGCYVQGIKEL